jgi:hypothetical protein
VGCRSLSANQILLGLALGIVASAVYLVWHRNFVRVWLALHQGSPLDAAGPHAALLPRFRAVLERAGTRLPGTPGRCTATARPAARW